MTVVNKMLASKRPSSYEGWRETERKRTYKNLTKEMTEKKINTHPTRRLYRQIQCTDYLVEYVLLGSLSISKAITNIRNTINPCILLYKSGINMILKFRVTH